MPVLTRCLNLRLPAHHQPVVVLSHAIILAFIRGPISPDPLEAGDIERPVGQHKGILAVHDHDAIFPPCDGDRLDALHLAVEDQGLLLHSYVIARLHNECQFRGMAKI